MDTWEVQSDPTSLHLQPIFESKLITIHKIDGFCHTAFMDPTITAPTAQTKRY